jgi:dihydroxy-acid dehydratase
MDAKTKLKDRLPSRHVTEGPDRAPHRSYYYAMGLTTAQIHQPFVGVASCWNEAAPCNIALMRQAQAAKKGVAAAGGTPREFCTITVTDGIAMGHDGMKGLAAVPRGDRRFRRADDPRPRLRRPRSAWPAATSRCPA